MRVLPASAYRTMPWKNGGGTTTEIAVAPAGAGLDDFDWRVSMARVEEAGRFSCFSGVDRTLSVLDGEGIVLHIADRAALHLTRGSQPLSFAADEPVRAEPIGGPIVDLNVMTRRACATHTVERLTVIGNAELACTTSTTLIFCHEGRVRIDGTDIVLGPLDTLQVGSGTSGLRLTGEGPVTLLVLRIADS